MKRTKSHFKQCQTIIVLVIDLCKYRQPTESRSTVHIRLYSETHEMDVITLIKGLSTMLTDDVDRKAEYVFTIYDYDFNGQITVKELARSLMDSLIEEDVEAQEEGMKEMTDLVRKHLDTNHDGFIQLEEFKCCVKQDSLLLDAFGPCLPKEKHKRAFLDFISPLRITSVELQEYLEARKRSALTVPRNHPYTRKERIAYPIHIIMYPKKDLKSRGRRLGYFGQ